MRAWLREFLAGLPASVSAAFEFRHPSWFDDEVTTLLADRGAALVAGDHDEGEPLPLIATAPFGYLRLRAASYELSGLQAWHERIAAQPWQRAFVYLKHEVLGPAYAEVCSSWLAVKRPACRWRRPRKLRRRRQRKAAKRVAVAAKQAARATKKPATKKPAKKR